MYYELNLHARRTRVPCEYSRVPLAADIDVFWLLEREDDMCVLVII